MSRCLVSDPGDTSCSFLTVDKHKIIISTAQQSVPGRVSVSCPASHGWCVEVLGSEWRWPLTIHQRSGQLLPTSLKGHVGFCLYGFLFFKFPKCSSEIFQQLDCDEMFVQTTGGTAMEAICHFRD